MDVYVGSLPITSPRVRNLTAPCWSLLAWGTPRTCYGLEELRTKQMENLLTRTRAVPTEEERLGRKLLVLITRILKSEFMTWLQIRALKFTTYEKRI